MTCAGEGVSGRRLSGNSIMEKRQKAVEHFWKTGELQPQSNVQFGEGGAGTFSDGKLNTGTKDPRARKVLEELALAGAPEEILYMAKPHVGTDRLPQTVKNIRETICKLGGEVRFASQMLDNVVGEMNITLNEDALNRYTAKKIK